MEYHISHVADRCAAKPFKLQLNSFWKLSQLCPNSLDLSISQLSISLQQQQHVQYSVVESTPLTSIMSDKLATFSWLID